MEVKIGVLHTPREIVIESSQTPPRSRNSSRRRSRASTDSCRLIDERGRKVIVPANLVAYVEIAQSDVRRVGFAAG